MRPVSDLKEIDIEFITVALTGDGHWEHEILRALAERYNGNENVLLIPIPVALLGRGNRRAGRFSGLSALQAIKTYVGKYRIERYLFVVDIEHINETEEIGAELETNMRELGFSLPHIEPLGSRAFLMRCRVGSHDIAVHTVISGEEKCIEENIARLVKLEWNIDVAPSKWAIRSVLRQREESLLSFLKSAASTNLGQAFPDLTAAFENMEKTALIGAHNMSYLAFAKRPCSHRRSLARAKHQSSSEQNVIAQILEHS
jgi:hypothetical protein